MSTTFDNEVECRNVNGTCDDDLASREEMIPQEDRAKGNELYQMLIEIHGSPSEATSEDTTAYSFLTTPVEQGGQGLSEDEALDILGVDAARYHELVEWDKQRAEAESAAHQDQGAVPSIMEKFMADRSSTKDDGPTYGMKVRHDRERRGVGGVEPEERYDGGPADYEETAKWVDGQRQYEDGSSPSLGMRWMSDRKVETKADGSVKVNWEPRWTKPEDQGGKRYLEIYVVYSEPFSYMGNHPDVPEAQIHVEADGSQRNVLYERIIQAFEAGRIREAQRLNRYVYRNHTFKMNRDLSQVTEKVVKVYQRDSSGAHVVKLVPCWVTHTLDVLSWEPGMKGVRRTVRHAVLCSPKLQSDWTEEDRQVVSAYYETRDKDVVAEELGL